MRFGNQDQKQPDQVGEEDGPSGGKKLFKQLKLDGSDSRISTPCALVQFFCLIWIRKLIRAGMIRNGYEVMFAAALACFSIAPSVLAQGAFTILQTGSGQALVSDQEVLQTGGITSPLIQFDFGFATDETLAPGVFLDSFTVSFEDASSNVAIVATADASGVVWAPTSPGSVGLTGAQIQRQTITPPSLTPVLAQSMAYSVEVPVPSAFTGSSVTVFFDLFDNQNSTASRGWYGNLLVTSVPEPQTGMLASIGLGLLAFKRKFGR